MRHHLSRPAAVAAGLTVAVAVCAAAGTAVAGTAARPAAAHVTSATATSRPVFLVNGDQLLTRADEAAQCVTVLSFPPRAGKAGSLRTLTAGGQTYAFPASVVPYLGHGLDLSLFDVAAVAAAESGGRLPVRVDYTGQVPSLPGVTITASGGGVATGYLTAGSAAKFGVALARQFAADHAHGSYGQHGLFAGGVSLSLAGTAPAVPTASQPKSAMETVTVTGTNRAGKPDTGDLVWLFNADDSSKFDNPQSSGAIFKNGVAKFSVPAGNYWALGDFVTPLPKEQSYDEYLDALPQFSVTKATTAHVSAQAASSEIAMVTSKPAIEQSATFQFVRSAAAGPAVSLGWIEADGGPQSPAPALYVNPAHTSPTVGTLATATSAQLGTSAFPAGSRYLYGVAFQSSGTIPAQHHVISQASLATEHLRYYAAVKSYGLLGTFPAFPLQYACSLGGALFSSQQFPAHQTEYLSASPALSWSSQYILNEAADYSGGQVSEPQVYLPGEQVSDNLGAYPLHPAPNYRIGEVPGLPPVQVSAGRAGNTLRLAMTAFSDSVPGHVGQGTFPPVKTTGSYEIAQNGQKIAGGSVAHFYGQFSAAVPLSPQASQIQFTLNASESAKLNPLSTASKTVWTWISNPDQGATLPAGWTCLPGGQISSKCAVQPMMTLRYGVVGESVTGTTSPGPQVIRLSVGHIQLAPGAQITGAKVSVSFDGGKTWQAARIAGSNGSYAASFDAPADSLVTLRTSATDVDGDAVTETITNAYQVAYQG